MKKILAFGASSSSTSINRRLAHHVAKLIPNSDINLLDLNDFEMPIYSIDREKEGMPEPATRFKAHITAADAIIISLAEHNGTYTTAFKNILDWISRIEREVWEKKPMLLLSTSPGQNGAATVLKVAQDGFPYLGANIIAAKPVPFFSKVFSEEGVDEKVNGELKEFAQQLISN